MREILPMPPTKAARDSFEDEVASMLVAIENNYRREGTNHGSRCDAGISMTCTCPLEDCRPVMVSLVEEIERLKAELLVEKADLVEARSETVKLREERDGFRDSALMYAAMAGNHVGNVVDGYKSPRCHAGLPGCDDLACVCVCHGAP